MFRTICEIILIIILVLLSEGAVIVTDNLLSIFFFLAIFVVISNLRVKLVMFTLLLLSLLAISRLDDGPNMDVLVDGCLELIPGLAKLPMVLAIIVSRAILVMVPMHNLLVDDGSIIRHVTKQGVQTPLRSVNNRLLRLLLIRVLRKKVTLVLNYLLLGVLNFVFIKLILRVPRILLFLVQLILVFIIVTILIKEECFGLLGLVWLDVAVRILKLCLFINHLLRNQCIV